MLRDERYVYGMMGWNADTGRIAIGGNVGMAISAQGMCIDTTCYEVNDAFVTNVKAFLEALVRLAYSVLASLSRLAA